MAKVTAAAGVIEAIRRHGVHVETLVRDFTSGTAADAVNALENQGDAIRCILDRLEAIRQNLLADTSATARNGQALESIRRLLVVAVALFVLAVGAAIWQDWYFALIWLGLGGLGLWWSCKPIAAKSSRWP